MLGRRNRPNRSGMKSCVKFLFWFVRNKVKVLSYIKVPGIIYLNGEVRVRDGRDTERRPSCRTGSTPPYLTFSSTRGIKTDLLVLTFKVT